MKKQFAEKYILLKNKINLLKNIYLHIQEAQWTPTKTNLKRSTLIHIIIIKLSKSKEESWRKRSTINDLEELLHVINSWLLISNHGGQKAMGWHSKCWKRLSTKNFISSKTNLQRWSKFKSFPDKQNWDNLSLANLSHKKY